MKKAKKRRNKVAARLKNAWSGEMTAVLALFTHVATRSTVVGVGVAEGGATVAVATTGVEAGAGVTQAGTWNPIRAAVAKRTRVASPSAMKKKDFMDTFTESVPSFSLYSF